MPTRCFAAACRRRRTSPSRCGISWSRSSGPTGSGRCASGRIRRSSWTTGARMLELTRIYHFSAGHRLANAALSPEANAALYGPCHRPHGHNYYLEVTVAGRPDRLTGMAADLGQLDRAVSERVLDHVDHHTLESVPALAGVVTTGEGLAHAFWHLLAPALPSGTLRRVTVVETAKNRFEYHVGESCGYA